MEDSEVLLGGGGESDCGASGTQTPTDHLAHTLLCLRNCEYTPRSMNIEGTDLLLTSCPCPAYIYFIDLHAY